MAVGAALATEAALAAGEHENHTTKNSRQTQEERVKEICATLQPPPPTYAPTHLMIAGPPVPQAAWRGIDASRLCERSMGPK
jgi:hypothetical protein